MWHIVSPLRNSVYILIVPYGEIVFQKYRQVLQARGGATPQRRLLLLRKHFQNYTEPVRPECLNDNSPEYNTKDYNNNENFNKYIKNKL